MSNPESPELQLITRFAAIFRSAEDDASECRLTEHQVVERFCALMGEVREHLRGPADCICHGSFRDPTGYRNDGTAVQFIEDATRAAVKAKFGGES